MRIGPLDSDKKVVVIAEIGNNHEGDFERARDMVHAAVDAGADAVKFQTFRTEDFVGPGNKARFDMLKGFELTFDEFARLKETADADGTVFISTPLDLESARFLNPLVPAFKIASGDNNFYPLLETVAGFGKPVLLSCGISGPDELRAAKARIEDVWAGIGADFGNGSGLAALHCVTSYPVPREQANLAAIGTLARELGCEVGYSDHTLGIEAAVMSVACGARIVEKHFTLDKNFSDFRDHQLSADPKDLSELVAGIRRAEEMLGTGQKVMQEVEKPLEPVVRRSVAAARDLAAGTVLTMPDFIWVRPSGGVPPGKENLLLGRTLARDAARGEAITPDMVG